MNPSGMCRGSQGDPSVVMMLLCDDHVHVMMVWPNDAKRRPGPQITAYSSGSLSSLTLR